MKLLTDTVVTFMVMGIIFAAAIVGIVMLVRWAL